MVSIKDLSSGIRKLFPRRKVKEELTKTKAREKLFKSSTRVSKKTGVAPERKNITELERLYYMEPLLFAGINFYKQVIARGFTLEGRDSRAKALIEEFLKRVDMESVIEKIVQDLGIYGNAFLELIWDARRKTLLDLVIIDPKDMVFITDRDGIILTDDLGKPIGYIQELTTEHRRERLEEILQAKGFAADAAEYISGIPFPAEDIAHFKWHTLSDTLMGVGLVEPLYDTIILKLKCEEALANAIDKYGFPIYVATLGKKGEIEPTPEEIKEFETEVLSQMEATKDIVLPYYYDVKILDVPKIDRLRVYLDYFVDLICTGMGVPHSVLLRGEKIGAGVSELQADQVEKTIVSIQRNLARTIREQLFAPIIEIANLEEVPQIKWKIVSPLTLSAKSRRVSELTRSGIVTPDRALEQEMRRLEDLPLLPEETKVEEQQREELRKDILKRRLKEDKED